MIWFFLCVGLLLAGYFTYGVLIERIFGPKEALKTPAYVSQDGVDFVPMSNAKVWLVQLLNIAGLGPVFGPILGALYGPVAMLWIVVGCIFAGAVHDYFSGMLSVRQNGASVPAIVGKQLGSAMKQTMNVFAVILLLLVGVVFVLGPAKLLGSLTSMEVWLWTAIIFGYYIGDDLKVVKYFREDRDYTHKVQSDFEDCMTVGSWTKIEQHGAFRLRNGNLSAVCVDARQRVEAVLNAAHAGGQIHEYIAQTQHQPIGQGVAFGGTHQANDGDLFGFAAELNCNFFMSHNQSFAQLLLFHITKIKQAKAVCAQCFPQSLLHQDRANTSGTWICTAKFA